MPTVGSDGDGESDHDGPGDGSGAVRIEIATRDLAGALGIAHLWCLPSSIEGGGLDALATAIRAASTSHVTIVTSFPSVDAPSSAATDGDFSAWDKLILDYVMADSTTSRVAVPAPLSSLLLRDERLDLSSGAAIAADAALRSVIRSPGGAEVSRLRTARRSRRAPRPEQD